VLTSDNPRTEDPEAILANILQGIDHPANVRVQPDRATAICQALAMARPGDCVLVAGKGHENYQIVGHRRVPLDDVEIARQWLYIEKPYAQLH